MEEQKTNVAKKNTAKITTKSGGSYSYKYTALAQINEYLDENNMKYYQYTEKIDNDDYIMTVPIIDGKEQAPRRGVKIVDATLMGNDNPAQKQGSATTYARRYSLLMAFGLATEDDDANSLTSKPKQYAKTSQTIEIENNIGEMYITTMQKENIKERFTLEEIKDILQEKNVSKLSELSYADAYIILSEKDKVEKEVF